MSLGLTEDTLRVATSNVVCALRNLLGEPIVYLVATSERLTIPYHACCVSIHVGDFLHIRSSISEILAA